MGVVYDDEPAPAAAPVIKYDEEASPSAAVFERGAPPLAGLAGLIAPGAPTPPDKYQQAAITERDRLLKAGVPLPEGYTRRLASGPLLGWGDEIGAAMMTPFEMARQGTINPAEGYRYAKAREQLATDAAKENTGITGDVVEGVGGLALLPGNVFGRQAAAALGGAGRGVIPSIARMAGYGAEAGTLGAIQGAGNARSVEDIPREALTGGAFSAVLGAPFGHFADVTRRSTAVVPSGEELFGLGARDAKAIDRSPVRWDTEQVGQRMADLGNATRNKYGRDTPLTVAALRQRADEAAADVAAARAQNVNPPNQVAAGPSGAPNSWQAVTTPRDIRSLKREIYEEGARGSPTDERAGVIASKVIDRITTRPDPALLAAGTPRDAATVAMLEARRRGNFAPAYRDRAVREVIDDSLNTAAGQHSGLNFENILRQKLRVAQGKEDFGALRPDENAALEALIRGTTSANAKREVGNMLGGGGGLGRMVAMGGGGAVGGGALGAYMTGGDPWAGAALGAAAGLTGRGIRSYGNAQARRGVEEFSDMIRRNSPEYARRVAAAGTEIGPGLVSPVTRGVRQMLTLGGGGDVRNSIVDALLYQATGKRKSDREKK